MKRLCLFLGAMVLSGASLAPASTLVVINTNNSGAGSLRQTIVNAFAGDTIVFSNSLAGTITLTSGELLVGKSLNILGPASASITISGNNASRVIRIASNSVVTIAGLAIANGNSAAQGAGIYNDFGCTLTLSNCTISGNVSSGNNGGGVANNGSVTARNCTFSGNEAFFTGGGIYTYAGPVVLLNCTVVSNRTVSAQGGGLCNYSLVAGTSNYMASTLVARNSSPAGHSDVIGVFTSGGYNLVGQIDYSTPAIGAVAGVLTRGLTNGVNHDLVGSVALPIDPLIGPLQFNGGPTFTHALLSGSPAIDQGKVSGLSTDQRLRPRTNDLPGISNAIGGDGSDIGSVEVGPLSLVVINTNDSGPGSLRQAINDASPVDGDTITFATNVVGSISVTSGPLAINQSVNIIGPGPKILNLTGGGATVFDLGSGVISISGLQISQGGSPAINNSAALTLSNCLISINGGLGLQHDGSSLRLVNCSFIQNYGGLVIYPGSAAFVTNCTFVSNYSFTDGGGVYNQGMLTLRSCTFYGNQAANIGGGILNSGTVDMGNTIVAQNSAALSPDISGVFSSSGYNLIGQGDGGSGFINGVNQDQVGTSVSPLDPRFDNILDETGQTPTAALLSDSPAVDRGNSFGAATDQRGRQRPFDFSFLANSGGGDGTDIGAFELAFARAQTGQCIVDWNNVRQRIDGFGASSAFLSTWTVAQADMFFSTNTGTGTGKNGASFPFTGIGLSLLRSRIAPGGTTVEQNIMTNAQARGAKIWSTPWTPPAAFKNPVTLNGGNLVSSPANLQNYASQLANYVLSMKNTYGINLYAISIQNEPDVENNTYETCVWTGQQIHDFIPYLYTALSNNGVASTKIMIPETGTWNFDLATNAMNDAATSNLVGIVAGHGYWSEAAPVNNYGKALWETEVSQVYPTGGNDSTMISGMQWAGNIHSYLTIAEVNAWHYWWLMSGNTTGFQGLADTNGVPTLRMYTLGNFSRFVRPNFFRIGVTNTSSLLVSAYQDPGSGDFAIVAVNSSDSSLNQTFNLTNFTANSVTPWITSSTLTLSNQPPIAVNAAAFTYDLPAFSVVTFVGQNLAGGTTPPALRIFLTSSNTVFISWPSASSGWNLRQNVDLNTTNWVAPLESLNDDGTNKFILVDPPADKRFYRLVKP